MIFFFLQPLGQRKFSKFNTPFFPVFLTLEIEKIQDSDHFPPKSCDRPRFLTLLPWYMHPLAQRFTKIPLPPTSLAQVFRTNLCGRGDTRRQKRPRGRGRWSPGSRRRWRNRQCSRRSRRPPSRWRTHTGSRRRCCGTCRRFGRLWASAGTRPRRPCTVDLSEGTNELDDPLSI